MFIKYLFALTTVALMACTGSTGGGGGDSNGETSGHDPGSTGSGFITGSAYTLDYSQSVETDVNIDGTKAAMTGDVVAVSAGTHKVTFGSLQDPTVDALPTYMDPDGLTWAAPEQTAPVTATTDATEVSVVEGYFNRYLDNVYECTKYTYTWDTTKKYNQGDPVGAPAVDDPLWIRVHEGQYLRGDGGDNSFGATGNDYDVWTVEGDQLQVVPYNPDEVVVEGRVYTDDSFSYLKYNTALERVYEIVCLAH